MPANSLRIGTLVVVGLLLARPAVAEEGAPRIYVVKPALVDLPETALPAILDAIGQAAQDEGVQALTENDVATLLRTQVTLQTLGADSDELSLASLGKAVGATHLVTATVSRSKDDTTVSCRLVDAAGARVLARREVKASEHGGSMLDAVKVATRLVVAPVFAGRKGTVRLVVNESGADVLVDGDIRGTTPVAPFDIAGGTHVLGVRKERFITQSETLRIVGGEVLERFVTLKPSPDYLRSYKEEAGRMRTVAWSGTVTAVVAGAATVVLAVLLNGKNAEVAGIRAEYDALTPTEQLNQGAALQARIDAASAEAQQFAVGSYVAGGVAGVGLLAGAFGWVFGNDPGKYD